MSKLQRVVAWFSDYFTDLLLIFLPVIFGVGQWLTSEEALAMLSSNEVIKQHWQIGGAVTMIVSLVFYIPLLFFHFRQKKRTTSIEAELSAKAAELETWTQDIATLAQGYVFSLAIGLRFDKSREKTERITIYTYDPEGFFLPFARFSFNTDFNNKGRGLYPDHQGCISKAWQHGRFFANNFPDAGENWEEYKNLFLEEGFSEDEIRALTMKSRLYFGWRILDTRGEKPLAVVIVESTNPKRWTQRGLEGFFNRENRTLSEFVERISPRLPKVSIAKKAGL